MEWSEQSSAEWAPPPPPTTLCMSRIWRAPCRWATHARRRPAAAAEQNSPQDVSGRGHDVLVNATGVGARYLADVRDARMEEVRGKTVLVRSVFDKIWIRRGTDYTYCLPRLDGTAILGGIKQFGSADKAVDTALRKDIFRRIHESLPQAFPSADPADFDVIRDIVGIRPQRRGGARIEKEVLGGQTVVHAYGPEGGGYIYSWGLARTVVDLVVASQYEQVAPASVLDAKL